MADKMLANEVLAFIQHAIDTMDEVSILQICKTNFTTKEIEAAKVLLYGALGKSDRMPSRRRDEKGERSLQDIVTLLKGTDPDDVPAFVARDLNRLPPVTFDHVDVTRLLKDIQTLKASLAEVVLKLEASQDTIGELRAEVATLRNSVCRSPLGCVQNVNTRRGAFNPTTSFDSAKLESSPHAPVPAARGPPPVAAFPVPSPEAPLRVVTSTPRRDYSAAVTSQRPNTQTRRTERGSGPIRTEPPRSAVPAASSKAPADEDGFIKVERKKRKPPCRNKCGTARTGANHLLRPAIPVTYVYVSRLHYSTKPEDIVKYLETKTNRVVTVERLVSRNKVNFNSFVVRVPTEQVGTYLNEELWPRGVVFRKYRGRRRPPGAAESARS